MYFVSIRGSLLLSVPEQSFAIMKSHTIVVLLGLIGPALSTISPAFQNFIRTKYGQPAVDVLARLDVGDGGSYGGGGDGNVQHDPVILVHGITNKAGTFFPIYRFFTQHGYKDNEVYATTYGDAGKTNVLFVTMNCHYVKVIRMLIIAVHEYTHRRVNVIGYSMGSPVARKAILGGRCVDGNEDVGPGLSHMVRTFIGVAGANQGSFLCVFPFGSCNANNGLHCSSRFLADINSRPRYEGERIYTIYSRGDDKVGYQACGKLASPINGQDGGFERGGNHDQLMFNTAELQYNLVTHGHP